MVDGVDKAGVTLGVEEVCRDLRMVASAWRGPSNGHSQDDVARLMEEVIISLEAL